MFLGDRIGVYSLHPGGVATNLGRLSYLNVTLFADPGQVLFLERIYIRKFRMDRIRFHISAR
jgi:hypothetical protein